MGKLIDDMDLKKNRSMVKSESPEVRCRSVMMKTGGAKMRKISIMASKPNEDLWLRSVPLQEVIGEIRMGYIAGVRSTWVNGDQDH